MTGSGVQAAQSVLTVYDVVSGRTEAFLPIEGKGFEPKALRTWLAAHGVACPRRLPGDCRCPAHTERRLSSNVHRRADYLLLVKHNQRRLCSEDIGYLFSQPPDFWFPERRAQTVEAGHGPDYGTHAACQR